MRPYADLHIHTTISDGLHTPSEIVSMALKAGLRVIAITDHDAIEGVAEAHVAAAGSPLQVIAGVEISASLEETECHVLGYFVDTGDVAFAQQLELFRAARLERVQTMLARLHDLGVELSWERVQELGGEGSLGRPHVARALMEAGYVSDAKQAFDRYLARGRSAYVPRYKVTPVEAVHMIRDAGGLPVLAHPWETMASVPALAAEGLVGLEAYYAGYNAVATHYLCQLAQEHGLLCTGGSDFHGRALLPRNLLGDTQLPQACVQALYALHESASYALPPSPLVPEFDGLP